MRPLTSHNIRIDELASLDFYTEGPAVDAAGNIFATTLSGGDIVKIDPSGTMTIWATGACPNGQLVLPNGDHLVCDSKLACIYRFDQEGALIRKEIKDACGGVKIEVPNDLAVDASGNLFFTDSVRHTGKIGLISNNSERVFAGNLDYPNGLAISADGKRLYVSESFKNRILYFDLSEPGSGNNRPEVFADLPTHPSGQAMDNLPDGLTIDHNGNLWIAHYGMGCVHQYSKEGKHTLTLHTGLPLTSNIFFAGKKTAIVTGGSGEPGPGKIIKITV